MRLSHCLPAPRTLLATLLGSTLLAASASAQVFFSENFDNLVMPGVPAGWTTGATSTTNWHSAQTALSGCVPGGTGIQLVCNDGQASFFANPCNITTTSQIRTPALAPLHTGDVRISFSYYLLVPGAPSDMEIKIASSAIGAPAPMTVASSLGGNFVMNAWTQGSVTVPHAAVQPYLTASGGTFEVELLLSTNGTTAGGFATDEVSVESVIPTPVAFCFGDTNCPCGNISAPGGGCLWDYLSGTPGAILGSTGGLFTSTDDLALTVQSGPPGKTCMFLQGAQAPAAPFLGDGKRCFGGSSKRLQIISLDSNGAGSTNGVSLVTAGSVVAGQTLYYQAYFRADNIGGGQNSSTCGTGFNLTNGLIAAWQ